MCPQRVCSIQSIVSILKVLGLKVLMPVPNLHLGSLVFPNTLFSFSFLSFFFSLLLFRAPLFHLSSSHLAVFCGLKIKKHCIETISNKDVRKCNSVADHTLQFLAMIFIPSLSARRRSRSLRTCFKGKS